MGKLYFHYSTMNAGKSTALLQANHNYIERGMKTHLLTAKLDDRAGVSTGVDTTVRAPACCACRIHRAACRGATHCTYAARVLASGVPHVLRSPWRPSCSRYLMWDLWEAFCFPFHPREP